MEKQAKQEETRNFAMHYQNFAGIVKIRNHSENFTILAKFLLCEIFAKLAKFR